LLPFLSAFPIQLKLLLVDFSPCLDESALFSGQLATQKLDWADREGSLMFLETNVEVRQVMFDIDFHKHQDDDPEEA